MDKYEIKDAKIEGIAFFDKRKDGTPLVTRPKFNGQEGTPYKKVLIDISKDLVDDPEFGGTVSMLDFEGVADNWEVGTTISGTVIRNGDYWNFELPKEPTLKEQFKELEKRVERLESAVFISEGESTLVSEDDIDDEELPF